MISAIESDTRLIQTRNERIGAEPTPFVFRSSVDSLVRMREAPEKDDFAHLGCRDNENEKAAREVRRHFAPIKDKDKRENELSVSLSIAEIIASRNDERVEWLLQLHKLLGLVHRKRASHLDNRRSRLCRGCHLVFIISTTEMCKIVFFRSFPHGKLSCLRRIGKRMV